MAEHADVAIIGAGVIGCVLVGGSDSGERDAVVVNTKFAGVHIKQVYWILGGVSLMFVVSLVNYQALLERGYRVDFTMVRMKRGKQEDYETGSDLVLDDWR